MNPHTSDDYLKMAQENLLKAEGGPKEYSLEFSNIASSQVLVAIALELKRFNDEADLERERQERKLESEIDKDLGW